MATDIRHTIDSAKSWLAQHGIPFGKKRLKKFYSELIEPGNLCYDIGAGLGNRTEAWSALGAQVICVEPQSDRMSYIEKRVLGNHNIFTVRKAIGNENRMTIMHVNDALPIGAGTLTEGEVRAAISEGDSFSEKWDKQEPVEIITLDDLIKVHGLPDFCQINAKGYEVEILKGLSQSIKGIAFGYLTHAPSYALECIARLEKLGDYECKWVYQGDTEFAAQKWITPVAMRTVLRGFHQHERSGDIYARLRSSQGFYSEDAIK